MTQTIGGALVGEVSATSGTSRVTILFISLSPAQFDGSWMSLSNSRTSRQPKSEERLASQSASTRAALPARKACAITMTVDSANRGTDDLWSDSPGMYLPRNRVRGKSWRVDETYVRVAGNCAYLYRAVDSAGETIEFMISPKRDLTAAKLFLRLALSASGGTEPRIINVDGHPA
jgi:hypothetical protein